MTQLVYIQLKAEDLRLGNMLAHWAVMDDGLYPDPSRIMDIHKKNPNGKKLIVKLADGRTMELMPEMLVVIQEVA